MKGISKLFSIVFHPMFMPVVGLFILFNAKIYELQLPFAHLRSIVIFVGLFTILLPLSFLPLMYYWKLIRSVEINQRKERYYPLLFTAASLVTLNILVHRYFNIEVLRAYSLSIAVTSVMVLVVNFFTKISLHLTALGGICGLIAALSVHYNLDLFYGFAGFILLSGVIGSMRQYLQAHSISEVLIGFFLGIATNFSILYFFLR